MYFGARGKYKFYADTNINESSTSTMYEWYTCTSPGSGTAKMVLLNSGNVGIGTTTPASKLHIQSAANSHNNLIIDNTTSTYNSILSFASAGSQKWSLGINKATLDGSLDFYDVVNSVKW